MRFGSKPRDGSNSGEVTAHRRFMPCPTSTTVGSIARAVAVAPNFSATSEHSARSSLSSTSAIASEWDFPSCRLRSYEAWSARYRSSRFAILFPFLGRRCAALLEPRQVGEGHQRAHGFAPTREQRYPALELRQRHRLGDPAADVPARQSQRFGLRCAVLVRCCLPCHCATLARARAQ